ncbi:sugar transferase [Agarivorans albus]|uniref:Sugar transferase n=1 Tax=Agarivorans albus MKT 106 TaxID=1331007 RepID=R9PTM6_AGAAL|nr:sugar transferase [Agarivorans albus]GAD02686.1 sugar transferase [Agarivorans albus MKT 106]
MKNLAPIMVSTYSRLNHLKATIQALQNNNHAVDTPLYIFSDAAKPGDEEAIAKVRSYLTTIKGFKSVTIIERKTNGRVQNNRQGIAQLLKQYGRVIFIEDDIFTAPGFITFMNQTLDLYQDSPDILSVSGYIPELDTDSHHVDALLLKRFSGWGVGFWSGKYEQIKAISLDDFEKIKNSKEQTKRLNEQFGEDLFNRFRAEALGHLDGVDTRACYLQFVKNMYSVHPKRSLVQNTGNDGSGVHSSINDKYEVKLWDKTENFVLPAKLNSTAIIDNKVASFFRPDHRDLNPMVITNIIEQLNHKGIKDICLWGTDIMTDLFLQEATNYSFNIRCIMDSWAETQQTHRGYPLITPSQAIQQGEDNFVILSFASRLKMKSIAKKLSPNITIIIYEDKL